MSSHEAFEAGLPAGTVTMVFTDIEGSTSLLQALGDSYPQALADHHRLIREAFARNGAFERGSAGDGLYFVFPTARDAVLAAIDGQLALAGHAWPGGIAMRDRMGLHTGEPRSASEGYVGLDVHRAARICAAGHGGQILISQTTRDLVVDELRAPVELADLGVQRLRSLDSPIRLYQVTGPGLDAGVPAAAHDRGAAEQPPARGDELHRSRARDRPGDRDARAVVAPDPDRSRWGGQDAGRRSGWHGRSSTSSTTGSGSSSADR